MAHFSTKKLCPDRAWNFWNLKTPTGRCVFPAEIWKWVENKAKKKDVRTEEGGDTFVRTDEEHTKEHGDTEEKLNDEEHTEGEEEEEGFESLWV